MSVKNVTIATCLIALLSLSACNTVQGVGRDITAAGEWGRGR